MSFYPRATSRMPGPGWLRMLLLRPSLRSLRWKRSTAVQCAASPPLGYDSLHTLHLSQLNICQLGQYYSASFSCRVRGDWWVEFTSHVIWYGSLNAISLGYLYCLDQWFSNLSMKYPQDCTFCLSPYIWHTHFRSYSLHYWAESGVIDEGDVQGWEYSRTSLRITGLDEYEQGTRCHRKPGYMFNLNLNFKWFYFISAAMARIGLSVCAGSGPRGPTVFRTLDGQRRAAEADGTAHWV